MESRIIQGVWEDVSAQHAIALKGHRVEIRVLDAGKAVASSPESWAAFDVVIGKLTRGKRLPEDRLLSAEDFYESRE